MKVGVTGTRKGATSFQITTLMRWFGQHATAELHHGDCIGVDAQVAQIAWSHGIHVIAHPPTDPKNRAFSPAADETRPERPYMQRNHDIVDEVDVLLVVPKTMNEERRSGTWACYRYAKKRGKHVIVFYPEEQS